MANTSTRYTVKVGGLDVIDESTGRTVHSVPGASWNDMSYAYMVAVERVLHAAVGGALDQLIKAAEAIAPQK